MLLGNSCSALGKAVFKKKQHNTVIPAVTDAILENSSFQISPTNAFTSSCSPRELNKQNEAQY